MSFNFLFIYILTIFIASILPGPSMLLALTHGMNYGAKRTLSSAMGNVTVTLVQASISIAGLGTILVASEAVFNTIKWAGAAYLIYIGIGLFLSPKSSLPLSEYKNPTKELSLRKMYLQAVFVTAGNPKAIVFFTAIFPQFIDPDFYLVQSCMLLVICAFVAFACFMIYAIGGQEIVSLFSKTTVGQYLNRGIGVTFIGVGIGLVASNK
ncbi:MAG: LysE family translocator [Desulfobacterales bacterium]